jgi:hypothetical protein
VVQLPRRRHRRRLRLRRCAHRGGRGNCFRFLLAVREFRLCACVRVPLPTCLMIPVTYTMIEFSATCVPCT